MENWLRFHSEYVECCWLVCKTLSEELSMLIPIYLLFLFPSNWFHFQSVLAQWKNVFILWFWIWIIGLNKIVFFEEEAIKHFKWILNRNLSGNAVIIKFTFQLQTLSRKFCFLLSKYFFCHISFHLADSYSCGFFPCNYVFFHLLYFHFLWCCFFDLFKSTGINSHSCLLIKSPLYFLYIFCIYIFIFFYKSFPFASHNEYFFLYIYVADNVFQLQSKGNSLLEERRQFKLLSDGFIRCFVCLV